MVMELAGKYKNLRAWAETPEATEGQYPTLQQELDRRLRIFRNAVPGSQEAVQAEFAVNEMKTIIKTIIENTDNVLNQLRK
jgi:hypothetical protein